MNTPSPLSGRHIVVTRPIDQAGHLTGALDAIGAIPVLYPVLEIRELADPTLLLETAIRLDSYDMAVFVSPNAIEKALRVILSRRAWPAHLRVAALGQSSRRELERHGIVDIVSPEQRFDSEALLELPELQAVAGRRIVVFRGDGGRELLGDTLKARGAIVDFVSCYHRTCPKRDPGPLFELWETGRLDAITLTSSEGLRNFNQMIGRLGLAWLKKTPVFVPHARIAEQAHALGITRVVATPPGDAGLISGLTHYFASPYGH